MEEGEEAEAVMDIMDFFPEADAGYLMARVMEITNAEDLNERDEAIASLASYIEKIEEPKVNKALDDIRDSYGYTEVWRMAIFFEWGGHLRAGIATESGREEAD